MNHLIGFGIFAFCFIFSVHGFDIDEIANLKRPLPERIMPKNEFVRRMEEARQNLEKESRLESIKVEEPKHHPSCLILSISDILKEHISSQNVNAVTVLFQHSLETCPGLKSTFEILQKIMEIKEMNFEKSLEFIQNFGKPATDSSSDNNDENDSEEKNKSESKESDENSSKIGEAFFGDLCKMPGVVCKNIESSVRSEEENNNEFINVRNDDHFGHLLPPLPRYN